MTGRTLTENEWALLAEAEEPLYVGDPGCHGYTDVNYINDSYVAAAMWDNAFLNVDGVPAEDRLSSDEVDAEVAQRVAYALAVLSFGIEFPAEGIDGERVLAP